MMELEKLFNYKATHWKNKMLTAKDKEAVAVEYCMVALRTFCDATNYFQGVQLVKVLKELDKHARYMVVSSKGISGEYRLTEDWIRTIIAQLSIHGAGSDDNVYKMIENLWSSMGWDAEKSINPVYNEVNTVIPFNFDNDGEIISFNIVLEPTAEFPEGSQYESIQGRLFNLCYKKGDSYLMQGEYSLPVLGYNVFPMGEQQLRSMKRVK